MAHSFFRGNQAGIFGQNLIDHIAAVGAALVGQLINFMYHILREDEGIDGFLHKGEPPPFQAFEYIVNLNMNFVKKII